MFKQKKGQSTLEYAVIIAVVVAALLAIRSYMNRGIQGKLRDSTDQIGEQFAANKTYVHSYQSRSGITVQQVGSGETNVYSDGQEGSAIEEQTVNGSETVYGW